MLRVARSWSSSASAWAWTRSSSASVSCSSAEGATSVLHRAWFASPIRALPQVDGFAIPVLCGHPRAGRQPLLASRWPSTLGLVARRVVGWVMRRTSSAWSIRAAGERPDSLDAAGVSVVRVRTRRRADLRLPRGHRRRLPLDRRGAGTFVPFVTNGAGFIAIVIAMLARGRAYWSVVGRAAVRDVALDDHRAPARGGRHPDRRRLRCCRSSRSSSCSSCSPATPACRPRSGLPYHRGSR